MAAAEAPPVPETDTVPVTLKMKLQSAPAAQDRLPEAVMLSAASSQHVYVAAVSTCGVLIVHVLPAVLSQVMGVSASARCASSSASSVERIVVEVAN